MKFLVDFFPIALFFVTFKLAGIYVATGVAIAATLLQIGWLYFRNGKVEAMQWVSLVIIVLFGGATLLFHDDNIKVSRKSISTFLKKYIETKSIHDKPRSGRNKKLTPEEINLIGEVTRLNRDITAPKIKEYLNLNVSTYTILRASKLFEWNKLNPNSNEAKKAAALERQLNGEPCAKKRKKTSRFEKINAKKVKFNKSDASENTNEDEEEDNDDDESEEDDEVDEMVNDSKSSNKMKKLNGGYLFVFKPIF